MRRKGLLGFLTILSACGTHDPVTAFDTVSTDTIRFADTVGVLLGEDHYQFGQIHGVLPVPEGFAVLDGIRCRLSFFSPEGDYLAAFGRQGNGPGEFQMPWRACRLRQGEFAVFDYSTRIFSIIDPSSGMIASSQSSLGSMILSMMSGSDSMIVLQVFGAAFDENRQLNGFFRISSMNAYTLEEGVEYSEHMIPLGSSGADLLPYWKVFTTDTEGNLYLSLLDSDVYEIQKLSPEGVLLGSITVESGERPAFDPGIHVLKDLPIMAPITTSAGSSPLRVSSPRTQPYVSALAVDGEGNIWVRRMGLPCSEHWDVLAQDGELLRKVILVADTTGSGGYPALHVSPFGLAATMWEYEVERFYTLNQ